MSRIIRVIIQNSSYQKITERRLKIERSGKHLISLFLTSPLFLFRYKEIWIITLIIQLIVYILAKSKHLILPNQHYVSNFHILYWFLPLASYLQGLHHRWINNIKLVTHGITGTFLFVYSRVTMPTRWKYSGYYDNE